MTQTYLALGGNVGPVARTFDAALEQIAALPGTTVQSVSPLFRFPAVGADAGDDFSNAAACIDTELDPLVLLEHLQRIETEQGRVRNLQWGPRPLDLDLIFYGDQIISLPQLRVPHPACWYRRFVLDPLSEIAADVMHPEKQATVGELRGRLLPRPLSVALLGDAENVQSDLLPSLNREFPDVAISASTSVDRAPADDPVLLIWLGSVDNACQFESLPLLSRLDASRAENPFEFVRTVLHSALGR